MDGILAWRKRQELPEGDDWRDPLLCEGLEGKADGKVDDAWAHLGDLYEARNASRARGTRRFQS